MPVTYLYSQNTYGLECSDCHTVVALPAWMRSSSIERDPDAEQTFRWHSGNGRYLNRCRSCERDHVRRWREARAVPAADVAPVEYGEIRADRSFGVEFECFMPHSTTRNQIAAAMSAAGLHVASTRGYGSDPTGWSIKGDGSLHMPAMEGIEVVSPVLSGDDGFEQITKVCEILTAQGCKINRTCGTHVHHDVSDLDLDAFKRVYRAYVDNQGVIDKMVSKSRRNNRGYCRRVRPAELVAVMNAVDLRHIGYRIERYRTVNVQSYNRYGTIEIRQHQGTITAAKIIPWIRMGQALIERAKAGSLAKQRTLDAFLAQLETLPTATAEYLKERAARMAEREAAQTAAAV